MPGGRGERKLVANFACGSLPGSWPPDSVAVAVAADAAPQTRLGPESCFVLAQVWSSSARPTAEAEEQAGKGGCEMGPLGSFSLRLDRG